MSSDTLTGVRAVLSPLVSRLKAGDEGPGTLSDWRLPPGDGTRVPGDLVVTVSTASETEWRYAAAERASRSGTRWVDLVLDPERGVRLGPLSHRAWSVCSVCAERRIDAARTRGPAETTIDPQDHLAPLDHLAQLGAALLNRELDALRADCAGSGLLSGRVISLDPAATNLTLHTVVAVADCPLCVGPQPRPSTARIKTDSVSEVLTALAGWVDPVTGVVPTLRLEQPLGDGSGLPFIATAAPPRIAVAEGFRELPIGWGKGIDGGAAIVSAVGEAVERYSASLPDPTMIIWSRAATLEGEVLGPNTFPLYSAAQYDRPDFPFARYDPGAVHPWVRGRWYGSDRPVWIPAVLAYLHLRLQPHQIIVQGSSNGLAAGVDHDDAADRAVLELLERDAFLTAWRTGRSLQPIDPASVPEAYQPTLTGLRDFGVTVDLAAVSASVGVSTIVAVGRGDGVRTPGACIGLAAASDPLHAAGSAILELAQTLPHLSSLMRSGQLPTPADAAKVVGMLDHAAYFFPISRARWFDRLHQHGSPPLDLSVFAPSEPDLADRLRRQGIRIAVVDVTAPDVASGPFRVVRAISPDLMPITFGYGLDRLVPDRVEGLSIAGPRPPLHPVW